MRMRMGMRTGMGIGMGVCMDMRASRWTRGTWPVIWYHCSPELSLFIQMTWRSPWVAMWVGRWIMEHGPWLCMAQELYPIPSASRSGHGTYQCFADGSKPDWCSLMAQCQIDSLLSVQRRPTQSSIEILKRGCEDTQVWVRSQRANNFKVKIRKWFIIILTIADWKFWTKRERICKSKRRASPLRSNREQVLNKIRITEAIHWTNWRSWWN